MGSQWGVRHHAERNTLLRYAKDVYEPLYRELKTMLDVFELAQKGEGPYPRFIHGGDKSPELPSPVSLTLWPTQKTWFSFVRAFTSDARVKLDRIEQAVSSYNKAVGDLFPWMKETLVGALLNPAPNGNISRFFNDWDNWSQEHQKNEITVAQEWLSIQYPIFEWLLTNRGREIGWIPSDLWNEQFDALFFQKRLLDIFEAVREKRQSDEQQAYEYERREHNEESLDEDEREEYLEKTDVIYFWFEFEQKQKTLLIFFKR